MPAPEILAYPQPRGGHTRVSWCLGGTGRLAQPACRGVCIPCCPPGAKGGVSSLGAGRIGAGCLVLCAPKAEPGAPPALRGDQPVPPTAVSILAGAVVTAQGGGPASAWVLLGLVLTAALVIRCLCPTKNVQSLSCSVGFVTGFERSREPEQLVGTEQLLVPLLLLKRGGKQLKRLLR